MVNVNPDAERGKNSITRIDHTVSTGVGSRVGDMCPEHLRWLLGIRTGTRPVSALCGINRGANTGAVDSPESCPIRVSTRELGCCKRSGAECASVYWERKRWRAEHLSAGDCACATDAIKIQAFAAGRLSMRGATAHVGGAAGPWLERRASSAQRNPKEISLHVSPRVCVRAWIWSGRELVKPTCIDDRDDVHPIKVVCGVDARWRQNGE